MSTFYGGPELINFLTASANRSGSAGTTNGYIVPAGRYARVQYVSSSTSGWTAVNSAGSTGIGSLTTFSRGENSEPAGNNYFELSHDGPIWLNEGESIRATITGFFGGTESITITCKVEEYVKP